MRRSHIAVIPLKNMEIIRKTETKEYARPCPRVDRLSSLPDALLVEILSFLPLHSAIITDTLSKRWRHLWTQITSVVISDWYVTPKNDLLTSIDQSVRKLTSPFVHTFTIEISRINTGTVANTLCDSWVRRMCPRQVRHLTVKLLCFFASREEAPPCIINTQSLESMKIVWALNDDIDGLINFNFPNLKKLSVSITPSLCEWLNKLADACPLLEDLSIKCMGHLGMRIELHYTSPNLRRLSVRLHDFFTTVTINAPKLEYLRAHIYQSTTLYIADELVKLRKARLELFNCIPYSIEPTPRCLTFYRAVSNVRILTLDGYAVHYAFTTFPTFSNLTRLTIDMNVINDFNTVLEFLQLCPVLDVLTLKFRRVLGDQSDLSNLPSVRTLERLKNIEINIWYDELELTEHFSNLIDYLLGKSSNLEQFCFNVYGPETWVKGTESKPEDIERSEYMLCDLLGKCATASVNCELLFSGRQFLMSRKAGPNELRADEVAIAIN